MFSSIQVLRFSIGNVLVLLTHIVGVSAVSILPMPSLVAWASDQAADDFEGEGRSPSRNAGGSRRMCDDQLIALVPGQGTVTLDRCQKVSQAKMALTVSALPTVWVHVPPQVNAQTRGRLMLIDAQDRLWHTQEVALSGASGIIQIPLTKALPHQQAYRWLFALVHNSERPTENPTVGGWIRRIAIPPMLADQLAQASSEVSRINLYTSHRIWYEALTTLGQLHQQAEPTAGQQTWQSLLADVGLAAIATQPFLDCCPLQPVTD